MEFLLQGQGEQRAAYVLNLSVNTVHHHVKSIYAAYRVHTRGELIRRILRPDPDDARYIDARYIEWAC